MLKTNQQAPDFSLPSTTGETFSLRKNFNKQSAILYFYPKDNTRVCTREACDFRDNFKLLKELNVNIVGISTDSIAKHIAFKNRYELPFDLLSDKNGEVSKLYKAYIPFLNLSKRVTYLLNEEHQVISSISDLFSAENHLKEMINKLKEIRK